MSTVRFRADCDVHNKGQTYRTILSAFLLCYRGNSCTELLNLHHNRPRKEKLAIFVFKTFSKPSTSQKIGISPQRARSREACSSVDAHWVDTAHRTSHDISLQGVFVRSSQVMTLSKCFETLKKIMARVWRWRMNITQTLTVVHFFY